MDKDAIKRCLAELWTATSHTPEQDANKDKQLTLYYQNLKAGNWTLAVVGKAFDNLSRDRDFWPSWAKVEEQLNTIQTALAPRALPKPTEGRLSERADASMETEIGQMALREGWGRSYRVHVERGGNPAIDQRIIAAFRQAKLEFDAMLVANEPSPEGIPYKLGKAIVMADLRLQKRFLRT